jgi:hypothetical protein
MVLCKGPDGKLAGVSDSEQEAYERFLAKVRGLGDGSITLDYRLPRSPRYHRRYFAIVGALFASQEQFDDPEMFRKWLEIGAGYCRMVPGPKGRLVAVPDSIAYVRLDQAAFEQVAQRVEAFARSLHATRFLFGHLSDAEASNLVDAILEPFR